MGMGMNWKFTGVCGLVMLAAACTSTEPPPPPAAPVEATTEVAPKCLKKTFEVYFSNDEKSLNPQSKLIVDELIKQANQCSPSAIEVVGHADSIGSEAVNVRVSQARADAVLNAIIESGVTVDRLAVVAAGERDARTEDNNLEPNNRRVDVYFID